jgi:hypothetical protein
MVPADQGLTKTMDSIILELDIYLIHCDGKGSDHAAHPAHGISSAHGGVVTPGKCHFNIKLAMIGGDRQADHAV